LQTVTWHVGGTRRPADVVGFYEYIE